MSQPFQEVSQLFQDGWRLFSESDIKKSTFCGRGFLSLFSRLSLGVLRQGIRERKENGNLNKKHIFYFGVLWSFLGSSLVFDTEYIERIKRRGILRKVLLPILTYQAVVPTLYGTTLQPYGCVTARVTPFYVLRLILKVGTFRAQYSECVPSHSFTLVLLWFVVGLQPEGDWGGTTG